MAPHFSVTNLSRRTTRNPDHPSLREELTRTLAAIREAGGLGSFVGLYHGDHRVAARRIEGKFGYQWLMRRDEEQRFGRKWVPSSSNSRVQRELGLREAFETAPADAEIQGGGDTVPYVHTFRTGDPWGLDATETTRTVV